MPELLEMGFETKQRMIGASAVLFGIVAHAGSGFVAIDGQDDRVEIEGQTRSGFRQRE
jgi:hypothetical protein